MSRWKLALTALVGAGLLSIGVLLSSAVIDGQQTTRTVTLAAGQGQGSDHKDFIVTGQVTSLDPGVNRSLVLTVRNPNNFAIRVTSVTVAASAASSSCPAGALTLPSWTGSLLVPKDGTTTLTLQLLLKATAPDACQGATWPLTYGGTAVKA